MSALFGLGTTPGLDRPSYDFFHQLLHRTAGIELGGDKRALVAARLSKRLRQLGLGSYADYRQHVSTDHNEAQIVVDLLTTNETQFFREPAHFAWLRDQILPSLPGNQPLRVWSAAASTGQEAYSIAMTLAEHANGNPWEVLGTDISRRVLAHAQRGQYDLLEAGALPHDFLRRYCLRGIGEHIGSFAMAPELMQHVRFQALNLNTTLPEIGRFEVIFLRNVLIYFRDDIRRRIVQRVRERLCPGGWLLIGHSEHLGELAQGLTLVAPSVYRA